MKKFALAVGAAAVLAAMPVHASLLDAPDGIRYRLESQATADPLTREFALVITRHNTAFDTRWVAGIDFRTGINAIAFNNPTTGTVASGVVTNPLGFSYVQGGLNSGGCNPNPANFFCFDNTGIPPTPGTALPTTPIIILFSATLAAGGNWTGYLDADAVNDADDPSFKIDWVGTENNYDLVSLNLDVESLCPDCVPTPFSNGTAPEPATAALLGLGLLGMRWFRRKV